MAACQVVEEECEDEWNERRLNIPGIGNVPMIAAMSGERTERQIIDMRNKRASVGEAFERHWKLCGYCEKCISVTRTVYR